MEDDRLDDGLKSLFADFSPALSSDRQFMSGLERSLESVEMIKRHNDSLMKVRIKAVVIALLAGFVSGFAFSFAMPYIERFLMKLNFMIAGLSVSSMPEAVVVAKWAIAGAVTVLISLNAYEISFSLMKPGRLRLGLKGTH